MVWMPKILKDELKEKLWSARRRRSAIPIFIDKIADETVGTDEATVLRVAARRWATRIWSMDPIVTG